MSAQRHAFTMVYNNSCMFTARKPEIFTDFLLLLRLLWLWSVEATEWQSAIGQLKSHSESSPISD